MTQEILSILIVLTNKRSKAEEPWYPHQYSEIRYKLKWKKSQEWQAVLWVWDPEKRKYFWWDAVDATGRTVSSSRRSFGTRESAMWAARSYARRHVPQMCEWVGLNAKGDLVNVQYSSFDV